MLKLFHPDPAAHTKTAAFAPSNAEFAPSFTSLFSLFVPLYKREIESYHIQVHRSLKQKHGGYLNSPDVYRGTTRPDSRRLCHTMALRGGENCLSSQELWRLHGLSGKPSPRTTRAFTFCHYAQKDAKL